MGGIMTKQLKPKLPTTKKILTENLLPIKRTLSENLLPEEDQADSEQDKS
jgi:hypothetical protein